MNLKIATACLVILASPALSQTTQDHSTMQHTEGMDHSAMGTPKTLTKTMSSTPTEPGQGAFSAIMEIVTILRADPETDWNRVNIDALRGHLVDMDMLVTNAEVTSKKISGGLELTASLKGLGGGAVSRMVPAHAPVLTSETGWDSAVQVGDETLTWIITSDQDAHIIQALGFFGLIAIGDHHQAHHIGMARGQMVHEH